MEEEKWLSTEDFKNYEVSNHGRVKSLARTIFAKDGSIRYYPERILKLTPNKTRGYVGVRLYREDGSYEQVEVHRLVALHFIPNPEQLSIVNHINTIRHDNRVTNLEWVTPAENITHNGAHRRGREKVKKKVYQYTLQNVFIKIYNSATDASVDGYDRSGICNVCNGYRPHHAGFIWRYE